MVERRIRNSRSAVGAAAASEKRILRLNLINSARGRDERREII